MGIHSPMCVLSKWKGLFASVQGQSSSWQRSLTLKYHPEGKGVWLCQGSPVSASSYLILIHLCFHLLVTEGVRCGKINPASTYLPSAAGVLGDACLVVDEHQVVVLSLYQYLPPSEPSKQASEGQRKSKNVWNIQAHGSEGRVAAGCVRISRSCRDPYSVLNTLNPGWSKKAGSVTTYFSGKSLVRQSRRLHMRASVGEALVSGMAKLVVAFPYSQLF